MKRAIRSCVWETNSSTTHSIAIMTQDDFAKWKATTDLYYTQDVYDWNWNSSAAKPEKGRFYTKKEIFDLYKAAGKVIDLDDYDDERNWYTEAGFLSYDEWCENEYLECEITRFTTPSGDNMVALCSYGGDY